MIHAITKGITGLAIAVVLVVFISFVDPMPWSFNQVLIGFALAGFLGPFFTAMSIQKNTPDAGELNS